MSRREFLNKTVMPVGTVLFLAFLFRPLCMVQGELDWRLLMLLVGIPFGIRKMFLWVVPSGMGIGGTVGVAAFDLMAGGVIGSVIMVWRLLVAVFTMIKGVAVGICRITGIGRSGVENGGWNGQKAIGAFVL